MKTITCSCTEFRKNKSTGKKELVHGKMTLRGQADSNGHLRFKCKNSHCGRGMKMRASVNVADSE